MDYLEYFIQHYPVRRSVQEKASFAQFVLDHMARNGIAARTETTTDGKNTNIIIGDPLTARVVCTAHYDTPAAALFPNMMIPRNMPLFLLCQFVPIILLLVIALGGGYLAAAYLSQPGQPDFMRVFLLVYLVLYYGLYILLYRTFKNKNNYNDNTSGVAAVLTVIDSLNEQQHRDFAFILFDNEEKGKKGSKAYYKDHQSEMKEKFLINFDCVGNGRDVVFIAMEQAERCGEYAALCDSFPGEEGFCVHFYPIKGSQSNSDYKNFPCGVGCMTCLRSRNGVLYTPRIHTSRDTVAHSENISYLAGGMRRFADLLEHVNHS